MLVALVQHVDGFVCLQEKEICSLCSSALWQSGIVCLDSHRGWRQLIDEVGSIGGVQNITQNQVAAMYMIAKVPTTIWFDDSQTSEDKCIVICGDLGITSTQALFEYFKKIALELLDSLNTKQRLPNFPFTKTRLNKVQKKN